MSMYKEVVVSCIDLALLLDWCEMTQAKPVRGKAISISEVPPIGHAYQRCKDALHHMYKQSRRYDTSLEAVVTEAAYEQAGVPHGV